MESTLRKHIESLERKIQELGSQLMNTQDHKRLNAIEAEIRMAGLALEHYRAALKLESEMEL